MMRHVRIVSLLMTELKLPLALLREVVLSDGVVHPKERQFISEFAVKNQVTRAEVVR